MNGNLLDPSSLDAVDYDPLHHLNLIFSHPSTTPSLPAISLTLKTAQHELSTDISTLESAAAYGTDSSLERMATAKDDLAILTSKIETVRKRAVETEEDITGMTREIKGLDGTKRNLTLSMTVLKRLQMLTTAFEQLKALAAGRQYKECAGLLQAVLQLMKHFNSYRSITQIATLSRGVSDLQHQLLEQVCEDFEIAFAKDEVGVRKATLVEAGQVMDALGDSARQRLMNWYINTELREYRQVFRGNDEAGNLDNIGRRYAWFKRMMKTYEDEHAAIFPSHWKVNEALATAFCDGTREDFKGILEKSMRRGAEPGQRMDVNLLLGCLQETLDFEQGLERRFALAGGGRASIDTLSSADERPHGFHGLISVAFEPYLSLWVEAQDKQLAGMIPKYRNQPLIPEDDEFSPQAVIPSAIELFHFYKVTLSQCAKLATGERLLELTRTFARYLDDYAQQVLLSTLQAHDPSSQEAIQTPILVLNTADFWHLNATQLEENIRKRIDPEFRSQVDLASQSDAFLGVASAAVLALVKVVEVECVGVWREMKNTNWSTMAEAGDQSNYVTELVTRVRGKAQEILGLLTKQQYARAFCDNLVERLAGLFIEAVVQCKPISEIGAQQMLVDKYALTKAFTSLILYHNPSTDQPISQQQPPASFTRRVEHSMNRMDPLLKTLQVPSSPPEGLVQAYLIHIADRSDTNFRKILDLKGVRKGEHPHLMELFTIHRDGGSNEGKLAQNSPLLSPLMQSSSLGSGTGLGIGVPGGAGGIVGGAARPTFDAGSLGEKLLSAARDIGSVPAASGVVGGGGSEKNAINENLRNFGKFFKRDIGGLGARFGMRDGSVGDGEGR